MLQGNAHFSEKRTNALKHMLDHATQHTVHQYSILGSAGILDPRVFFFFLSFSGGRQILITVMTKVVYLYPRGRDSDITVSLSPRSSSRSTALPYYTVQRFDRIFMRTDCAQLGPRAVLVPKLAYVDLIPCNLPM